MKLRTLELKDVFLMLEWMHDDIVVKDLKADFEFKTLEDCIEFIKNSMEDRNDVHLAITDETDEYLGTCSLKHLNVDDHTAEFGMSVRKKSMGRNISIDAMKSIIQYGFEALDLSCIYWCVDPNNVRALRFYDKN